MQASAFLDSFCFLAEGAVENRRGELLLYEGFGLFLFLMMFDFSFVNMAYQQT